MANCSSLDMAETKSPMFLLLMVFSCVIFTVLCVGCTSPVDTQKNTLAGNLTIHGSTALSPTVQEQARAFTALYPEVKINVTGSSSGEAIYYLISGKCDLAPSARVPTAAEYDQAKNAGKSLHMTVVGYDGVAVVVNSQNPASNISQGQLRQIFFNGTITDWSQIKGSGKTGPIRIYVQDPKASATAEFFSSKIAGGAPFTANATVIAGTSSDLLSQKILTDPDGLTFASTAYVYPNMKALPLDGVSPTPATMLDTTYPLSRKLYMVTDGAPAGLNKEFINFMFSQAGQKIAADKGIVPVS
jgi:phosphate transport system substrate-binding protein